jgi:zinc protease
LALDTSRFYIYADALPGVSIAEVEAALDEVIDELLLNGPSDEELVSVKSRMQDVVVYALDSPQTVANIFGTALSVGLRVEDVESWPERVAAVTRDRVMAAARAVLRLELSVTGILLPSEEG